MIEAAGAELVGWFGAFHAAREGAWANIDPDLEMYVDRDRNFERCGERGFYDGQLVTCAINRAGHDCPHIGQTDASVELVGPLVVTSMRRRAVPCGADR